MTEKPTDAKLTATDLVEQLVSRRMEALKAVLKEANQTPLSIDGSVALTKPAPVGPMFMLVKFFFTNQEHIPDGIPEVGRQSNHEMDAYHARMIALMGDANRATLGRLREGRVDTGDCVIENLPMAQVGLIRRGLANNGRHLILAHWHYQQPRGPNRRGKYVVSLTFAPLVEEIGVVIPELPRATVVAMRTLAHTTWAYCHVWDNAPVPVATINCVGRQPDAQPKHAIVVREHHIRAVTITEHVAEQDE